MKVNHCYLDAPYNGCISHTTVPYHTVKALRGCWYDMVVSWRHTVNLPLVIWPLPYMAMVYSPRKWQQFWVSTPIWPLCLAVFFLLSDPERRMTLKSHLVCIVQLISAEEGKSYTQWWPSGCNMFNLKWFYHRLSGGLNEKNALTNGVKLMSNPLGLFSTLIVLLSSSDWNDWKLRADCIDAAAIIVQCSNSKNNHPVESVSRWKLEGYDHMIMLANQTNLWAIVNGKPLNMTKIEYHVGVAPCRINVGNSSTHKALKPQLHWSVILTSK